MNKRQLLLLSSTVKFIILVALFLIVGVQHVVSKLWLSPIASDKSIEKELERTKGTAAVDVYSTVDGRTGLMIAAWRGLLRRVELLLVHKANPNLVSRDKDQNTALHLAASRGDSIDAGKIVQLLLKHSADANKTDAYGNTPVHVITNTNDLDVRLRTLTQLVDNGANINAQNNNGSTLVHRLVDKKDLKFLEKMYEPFKEKLDFFVQNKEKQTPLQRAKGTSLPGSLFAESEESMLKFLEHAEKNQKKMEQIKEKK